MNIVPNRECIEYKANWEIEWFDREDFSMNTFIYIVAAVVSSWVGVLLTAAGFGGLLFVVLALLFAILKILGVIAWTWLWVLLPMWPALSGTLFKMWRVTRDPLWREKL